MGGIRPRSLQEMWAWGPLHDRHRVPTVLGYLAPSPRGKGQLGSRAVGGEGVRSPRIVNTGWDREDIRCSGYRSPVAGGEEVAGGVRRWLVIGCCIAGGTYVVSSPLACRGYDTHLPWH